MAGRNTEGTPCDSFPIPFVIEDAERPVSSSLSACFRLFPITAVGIPPRGSAAEGVERSNVRVFSDAKLWTESNDDSDIVLVRGVLLLVPRNVGATRFLPSLVIVIFCCKGADVVAKISQVRRWRYRRRGREVSRQSGKFELLTLLGLPSEMGWAVR
jgi:hypothetical protein